MFNSKNGEVQALNNNPSKDSIDYKHDNSLDFARIYPSTMRSNVEYFERPEDRLHCSLKVNPSSIDPSNYGEHLVQSS